MSSCSIQVPSHQVSKRSISKAGKYFFWCSKAGNLPWASVAIDSTLVHSTFSQHHEVGLVKIYIYKTGTELIHGSPHPTLLPGSWRGKPRVAARPLNDASCDCIGRLRANEHRLAIWDKVLRGEFTNTDPLLTLGSNISSGRWEEDASSPNSGLGNFCPSAPAFQMPRG